MKNKIFSISGFGAFIAMIFLNAFVDLGHKITIQNTIFKVYDGQTQIIFTALINALILLPYIFMFTPSGFLANKYGKHQVMRYSAIAAVFITLLITFSYYQGWFWTAFALTLLLAIQSAIYSPAKYGYIRELVGGKHLAEANGFVQATTITAILAGTFAFSAGFELLLPEHYTVNSSTIFNHIAVMGWALVGLSIIELVLAYRLPAKPVANADDIFDLKKYVSGGYLKSNIKVITRNPTIWLSIIGLSMFWAISQVVLASFPSFAKAILANDNALLIQGILACSGIGIVIGSLTAGRISKDYIELGLIPVGAVGFALMLCVMPFLTSAISMAITFILLGFLGGLFIIPLNTLIQYHADTDELGTVLAGNNWIQNLSMLSFLLLTVAFAIAGLDSKELFYLLIVAAIAGSIYTIKKLPHSLVRILVSVLIRRAYNINVVGFDNLSKKGGILLLGNHISWIDWAIVQIACPRPVRFVMLRSIYNRWYLNPFFKLFGVIPISSGQSKEALKTINEQLSQGEVVCLFPEGAISRTGQLGTFHGGYERAIEGIDVPIIPFYLHGLWGSLFSRSASEKLRKNTTHGLKRDIIIAFGKALPSDTQAEQLKQHIFQLSINAWQSYADNLQPIPLAWFKTAKRHLGQPCAVDTLGDNSTSHAKMMAATSAFASAIKKHSNEQNIGLVLPASSAGIITNMAVLLNGQTCVNLNYTASLPAVQAAIKNADIKTVYTSKKFVDKLNKRGIPIEDMLSASHIIYLEDIKATLTKWRLLFGLICAYTLPAKWFYHLFGTAVSLDSPAAILFSSGSEGNPKGIVLSHKNLMANIKQVSHALNTQNDDVIMGGLPPFHSFGLTVTSMMPLVEGIPVICHPDPTDVVNIAKAVHTYRATILLSTASFLRLYSANRKVQPAMLGPLRLVVAGAEKLSPQVRSAFHDKFNKVIYEGYGATETAPVASCNIPDQLDSDTWKIQPGHKLGSVGLPLPGTCFRIVDPETLHNLDTNEEGLILIAGPQLMAGYLNDAQKTEAVITTLDGQRWYKTGDKGRLDEYGFLTIVDRYSRFAKIAGEMISLGAIESTIGKIINDDSVEIAAVNVPDNKKGEKVILLTTANITLSDIKQSMLDQQCNPLMIPSSVYRVDETPKLGSGKIDFPGLKQLALSLLEEPIEAAVKEL